MAETSPIDEATLPGPGSVTWQRFGVAPGALLAGTGLLLQVAHPVVGQGVLDHSEFQQHPWKRAWGTHLSTMRFVYGMGDGARAEGDRLIALHRDIKGVDGEGRRYHALNPEAYAWVHTTLAKFMVDTAAWFCEPMTPAELARMWREWRAIGMALGLKPHHLPIDWPGAEAYIDEMVRDRLEANRSTADVLEALTRPRRPARALPAPLWNAGIAPAARLVRLTTVGTLPPLVRERLGLEWTDSDRRTLTRLASMVRATHRRAPEPLRYSPLAYWLIVRGRRAARHRVAGHRAGGADGSARAA
ncbi:MULTISPECIES: oxygenase MpaB family protein [Prauserella salsuginis group]|uniref:Uncharacterized protein (DUF2236 family) n=2 Tax=Prauserella salsuginis group TaxID=2893672 RepID=A0A839XTV9_9PSEU|nr:MULTISPECIES: oxygenase MpaB family protein [Prauserella salsuginis group]MBB3664844.1 uncharacterized protein (DUF2236 family) [Prauserella sediminis]MCR3718314.1 Uncharacterized conserved protein, DUF2236 family [Prauserella flava]MCR3732884.1 Uncharacterized conserved protein, DUF2236 family [Prauserella salsuginis]